eukprot:CAMPEP_0179110772 /NCGR_PEP_ID=MMETSP0796-20121207/51712_1 /TAXON_ID=73915 /ORGANISM="Pyrodinium bahamense, Strain pbaha01" /LENGTH=163 /DNA_ID=CAMNT_0020808913 /DNA_START=129 /DNA_END=618 /DNA_ORIENTATION=+
MSTDGATLDRVLLKGDREAQRWRWGRGGARAEDQVPGGALGRDNGGVRVRGASSLQSPLRGLAEDRHGQESGEPQCNAEQAAANLPPVRRVVHVDAQVLLLFDVAPPALTMGLYPQGSVAPLRGAYCRPPALAGTAMAGPRWDTMAEDFELVRDSGGEFSGGG